MQGWHRETGLSPSVEYFSDRSKVVLLSWSFYVFLSCVCYTLCARLFICALWSPAGLTSWLSFVVFNSEFVTPNGILGQVWYLILSIPDLCTLTYLVTVTLGQQAYM